MAAELYIYDVGEDGPASIRGLVVREGDTYSQEDFVDESGRERILTVFYGRVEIMSGRIVVERLTDDKKALHLLDMKHVETLEPGEERSETLTGPDGEERVLHVRNIDEAEVFPSGGYIFLHPSGENVGYGFGFN